MSDVARAARRAVEAWHRFWFTPESSLRLSACRILFFGGLFYFWRNVETDAWASVDPVFWFPLPLFEALKLSVPSADVLRTLELVYRVSLVLACIGLASRISMVVAFILGAYLIALPQNFGKVHHSDTILLFVLAGFALSRAGDHGSLDAWLRHRFFSSRPAPLAVSGEYRWPLRFGQLAAAIVYGAAGTAKLLRSGFEWADPEIFRNLILIQHYTHRPVVDWGLAIAEVPWLCTLFAGGTLVMETAAPLALLHRRIAMVVIPSLAAMQVGVYLVMGINFRSFLLLLPFWIPWDRLWSLAAQTRARLLEGAPRYQDAS